MGTENFEELYNQEVEAHNTTKTELEKAISDLLSAEEAIQTLSSKVNVPAFSKPAELPTVKLKSGKYQWTTPTVNLHGEIHRAGEASKEVCEKLVAMGSGVLVEVE